MHIEDANKLITLLRFIGYGANLAVDHNSAEVGISTNNATMYTVAAVEAYFRREGLTHVEFNQDSLTAYIGDRTIELPLR